MDWAQSSGVQGDHVGPYPGGVHMLCLDSLKIGESYSGGTHNPFRDCADHMVVNKTVSIQPTDPFSPPKVTLVEVDHVQKNVPWTYLRALGQ